MVAGPDERPRAGFLTGLDHAVFIVVYLPVALCPGVVALFEFLLIGDALGAECTECEARMSVLVYPPTERGLKCSARCGCYT